MSRFIALSRLFDLNIAATQLATGKIAVVDENRERVGVFAGLLVVAYVHLEFEAWSAIDLRVAQNLDATIPLGECHGRDSRTLDGLLNIVVLVGDVSAWRSTRIRLRGQAERSFAVGNFDPSARCGLGAGSARWHHAEVLEADKCRGVEGEERKLVGRKPTVPIAADR